MPKYLVLIEGKECSGLVLHEEDGEEFRPAGFFTTRFVEAPSPDAAAALAQRRLQEELAQIYVSNRHSCELVIRKVREDEIAFDMYAPGEGFTWY